MELEHIIIIKRFTSEYSLKFASNSPIMENFYIKKERFLLCYSLIHKVSDFFSEMLETYICSLVSTSEITNNIFLKCMLVRVNGMW